MMKNYFTLILLFFLTMNLSAQQDINPNGYNVFKYPDGSISSEGNMENGKPVGYWKAYYPNGVIRSEGNRKNNKLDSVWKFYDRKGNLEKLIDYKNGKRNGYLNKYELIETDSIKQNILVSKELFIDDKLNGKSYYYDDSGNLQRTTEYEDGKKHGFEYRYAEDGRVTAILKYHYGSMLSSEQINQYNAEGEKEGIWKEFYPSGQIKSFTTYTDGKKDGYSRKYSPVGLIESQTLYQKGEKQKIDKNPNERTEIVLKKYDDGTLQSKGAYKGDKPVGIHREFDEDGNITMAYEYNENSVLLGKGLVTKSGKRTGSWELFYPDGKTKAKGTYENGKRVGDWSFFFPNGKKEQTGTYKNGKPEGKWFWFYSDGSLRREGFYVDGKEHGTFNELSLNRDTLSTGEYVYGLRNGLWKLSVNDHTEIGEFKLGKKHGKWKHFYTDERLQFKGAYKNGAADGEHVYYYPNGRIKKRAEYSMGTLSGQVIKYDIHGVPETFYFFKSGRLVKIDGMKISDK